jgi:N-acetyl sugar amidotransferase
MPVTCSRCILDSSFPDISFDKEGICNHCRDYEILDKKFAFNEKNNEYFKKIIEKIKTEGKGKEYDSILGVSGGRDSTYCLYLLKKWGLNPIAVHFDNNMDSKIAAANIKNACSRLGVDLHTFVIDWEEYKNLQVAFLKASVPSVDILMDYAFISVLYDFAFTNKIRYIFMGDTFRGEGPVPREWSSNEVSFIKDIHKKFGKGKIEKFPIRKIRDLVKYKLSGMTVLSPLNYVDFAYADIMPLLEKELGWKWYGGHHFECIFTRWAFAYYLPAKFNIDKRTTDYSVLIRSGQISRTDALKKMKEIHYPAEQEREDRRYIMNKLGLLENDMENILKAPAKKNSDYRQNSFLLNLLLKHLSLRHLQVT